MLEGGNLNKKKKDCTRITPCQLHNNVPLSRLKNYYFNGYTTTDIGLDEF